MIRDQDPHKTLLTSSGITVGLVITLVFAKMVGYIFSGSAAVLSSLVDSLSDIALSMMTFLAIRWSLKPADEDHRHGHGKIEGVSALLQAAFLGGSGAFLVLDAISRFLRPKPVEDYLFAISMMAIAILGSVVLVVLLRRAIKKSPSLALEADYEHYSSDILLNGVVMVTLFLGYRNWAPVWIDPLCALFVAGLFARSALRIASRALDMLMDKELPQATREKIGKIIESHAEVISFHDLRTTQSGLKIFISFDLELDTNLLLWSAHEIARDVEQDLLKEFPNADILIHIDPHGDTADSRHSAQVHKDGL